MENKLFKMLLLGMFVLFSAYTQAQLQVSGTVKDNTGELLPGVSILVRGTTQGVVTDMNGSYSLRGNHCKWQVGNRRDYESNLYWNG